MTSQPKLSISACSIPIENTLSSPIDTTDIEDALPGIRCQLILHQKAPDCRAYSEGQVPCLVCPHRDSCQKLEPSKERGEKIFGFPLNAEDQIRYRVIDGKIQTGTQPYAEILVETSRPGLIFRHPVHPGIIYRTVDRIE